MIKIVKCVPNISDGKNPDVYNSIANSIKKIKGVKLLHVHPGFSANRTVITFVGTPDAVVDAAFELIKTAKELIDMTSQDGIHSRMGAADVCPLIPLSGVTMDECAQLARRLAKRVGDELDVWVYLYEYAAKRPEFKNLTFVRKGQYEHLKERVGKIKWKPDFGPEKLDEKFGAVAIGARKVLLAYNINIESKNLDNAQRIARNIRESGRVVINPDGTKKRVPGLFKSVKADAWIIPEYSHAQITMNLTDVNVTPVHIVYDEIVKQCVERGEKVTGSELIGLIPLKVLLDAGKYSFDKKGITEFYLDSDLINEAVNFLGLDHLEPFDPHERILENKILSYS